MSLPCAAGEVGKRGKPARGARAGGLSRKVEDEFSGALRSAQGFIPSEFHAVAHEYVSALWKR